MSLAHRPLAVLTLSAALVAPAVAQEAPPPFPVPPAAEGVPALVDLPWDLIDIQVVERRYRVEALRFKARDETGLDVAGSDEVMVWVEDSEGATASGEIGDVDSGDVHEFLAARSCVVAVVPGVVLMDRSSFCDIDDVGNPAPVSFMVEMWEKDSVGLDLGFCAVVGPNDLIRHVPPHCANDGVGDDFIGRAVVDLTAAELDAALPNVGDALTETVVLSPCAGGDACGGLELPDYSFTYRVIRVPDGLGFLQLELAEAMRRTGARSEVEVILAGLRALEAPAARRIEVEDGEPVAIDGATGGAALAAGAN